MPGEALRALKGLVLIEAHGSLEGRSPPPEVPGGVAALAPRMRFLDAVIAFGVYLVLQLAVAVAVGIIIAASGAAASPEAIELALLDPWVVVVLLAASGAAALCGAALVALVRSLNTGAFGLRPVSGRWLLAGLGVCALGIMVNIAVVSLYVRVSGDTSDPQAAMMGVALKGSALQFVLVLLIGGIVVPIGEELLFRGILFAWLRRWGLPLSVVLSSLAFGLFHGFSFVFFTAAILGAMLALLYEWSGSLWPPIVAHVANNLFSFSIERMLQ